MTKHTFFFRIIMNEGDLEDVNIWYPHLDVHTKDSRPISEWLDESFREFAYGEWSMDERFDEGTWQLYGTATMEASVYHSYYDGPDYEEEIIVNELLFEKYGEGVHVTLNELDSIISDVEMDELEDVLERSKRDLKK